MRAVSPATTSRARRSTRRRSSGRPAAAVRLSWRRKLAHALERSGSTRPAATASTSAPRREASPTACSSGRPRVIAVDVGYGQLHPRLRDDRVTVLERTNVRGLTELPFAPRARRLRRLVHLRPHGAAARAPLAAPGWEALVLVKPQFEAGRAEVRAAASSATPRCTPRVSDVSRSGARVACAHGRGRRLRPARPEGKPGVVPPPRARRPRHPVR